MTFRKSHCQVERLTLMTSAYDADRDILGPSVTNDFGTSFWFIFLIIFLIKAV